MPLEIITYFSVICAISGTKRKDENTREEKEKVVLTP